MIQHYETRKMTIDDNNITSVPYVNKIFPASMLAGFSSSYFSSGSQ